MARRKSTLDAFAPVRARPAPQEEPSLVADEQPAPDTPEEQETPEADPKPELDARAPESRTPAHPRRREKRLSDILESVLRQVPTPEGEIRRLTLYLPQVTYDNLQAVWEAVREQTGIKVSRASLVLAALEIVLDSPDLTESMIMDAVQGKFARGTLAE